MHAGQGKRLSDCLFWNGSTSSAANAAGCLAKNQQLATGGPYSYTRNPLYIGTLLVAAGLAIASRSPGLAALFVVVAGLGIAALNADAAREVFVAARGEHAAAEF